MAGRIPDLERSSGSRAERIQEGVISVAALARERLDQGSRALRDFTIGQPARALGLALGLGVILGWLIKRR